MPIATGIAADFLVDRRGIWAESAVLYLCFYWSCR